VPAGPVRLGVVDCGPRLSVHTAEAVALGRCADLRRVILHNNTATLDGLRALADSPVAARLQWLGVDGSDYTDDQLALLPRFRRLQVFEMSNCTDLTDALLPAVARLPELRRLVAINTRFTGVGLVALAPLRLEHLDLTAGSGIDDAGLRVLAGMPTLREVGLRDTAVTEAGVKRLAAALPGCRIEWAGGVVGPTAK
jgi:hypothetical protein